MMARTEKAAVAILLAAVFGLYSIYSVATPLFEASDELWHYPFVQHLATGGGLPVQAKDQNDDNAPWRQEGSQPPLYYALAALIAAPFDSSNWREVRRLNPHSDGGVPTRDGNANAILHGPAEQFPWTGAALQAHVVRFLSVVLSTLTVFFAFLVGCELFPGNAALRLGTLIFTAFVPMFAFIGSSINNDNAAILFCTAGTWWALRMLRLGDLSIRSAVVAGLVSALGILSKSSAIGLAGLFGLTALFVVCRARGFTAGQTTAMPRGSGTRREWVAQARSLVRFGLVYLAIIVLLSGWWFVRNQQLYGDWLGWNGFLDVVGRRVPPADLAQLWSEREGFVWAYWGVFGTLNVILPHAVYDGLNVIALVALAGILLELGRQVLARGRQRAAADSGGAVPLWVWQAAACVFWVVLIFVSLLRWTSLTPASQGRLMFPCIAVLAAGMAFGLWRVHRVVLWAGCAALVILAFVVPFAVIAPVYAKPPALADPRPAQPVGAVFGGTIELIGYDTPPATATPAEEVPLRLTWRVLAPMTRNYTVFVHLLDDNDVVVAQRDMYPGQGTLATAELAVGYTWSDHYSLRIQRRMVLPPERLRWEIGLYDLTSGERLTTTVDQTASDALRFGSLNLTRETGPPAPLLFYANGIQLLSYDMQPRSVSAGAPLTVTLAWRTTQPIGTDYTVSLQLLDERAEKIAQHDSAPANGGAPTTAWLPMQTVVDTHVLQVAPGAQPGVYRLLLVWYLPSDFSRLGAYDERGQFAGNQIELARIRVR